MRKAIIFFIALSFFGMDQAAWAHCSWIKYSLEFLSEDGRIALIRVSHGDTEGGSSVSYLNLFKLDDKGLHHFDSKRGNTGTKPKSLRGYKQSYRAAWEPRSKKEIRAAKKQEARLIKKLIKKYKLKPVTKYPTNGDSKRIQLGNVTYEYKYECTGDSSITKLWSSQFSRTWSLSKKQRFLQVLAVYPTANSKAVVVELGETWRGTAGCKRDTARMCMPPVTFRRIPL